MNRPTLSAVAAVVRTLVNETPVYCPKTRNKGAVGILCERLTGIPQSSAHLDCSDGEVKVFPLKENRAGIVPKETIAVTMLNRDLLAMENEFATSRCGSKLQRVLYVPYIRLSEECIRFFPPTELTMTPEITALLQKDYDAIRADAVLTSKTGVFLQNRTKGAGRGAPITRAFYLKKNFINTFIEKTW
jgi:hypothetical protein